ncbi:MAG: endonuclease/exonuclease/phosphatase family protein [Planctomycetota bacterium]
MWRVPHRIVPAHFAPLLLALLCTACAASRSAASGAPSAQALRVVSYNIRHGLGLDGQLDLARVARVLAAEAPDVVLLQEVDERTARALGVDQAAALGTELGMSAHFAPFMDYGGGRYGLAILSRLPVASATQVALPPGKQEPRAALVITLAGAGAGLHVANAHLDWLAEDTERVAQARALCEVLVALPGRVVFGGDLNDVPDSATLRTFVDAGFVRLGPSAATFPADAPVKTIDHFLWRGDGPGDTVDVDARVDVVAEPLASDHRPVALQLTLGTGER